MQNYCDRVNFVSLKQKMSWSVRLVNEMGRFFAFVVQVWFECIETANR